jgi:hypothetical protein
LDDLGYPQDLGNLHIFSDITHMFAWIEHMVSRKFMVDYHFLHLKGHVLGVYLYTGITPLAHGKGYKWTWDDIAWILLDLYPMISTGYTEQLNIWDNIYIIIYISIDISYNAYIVNTKTGWWFQPIWKILVNGKGLSHILWKNKNHVPNHPPVVNTQHMQIVMVVVVKYYHRYTIIDILHCKYYHRYISYNN